MRAFTALSSMKNGHWIFDYELVMSLCHFVGQILLQRLPSNDLSPAVTSGPECDELSLSIVDSASLLKQFIEVQQKKS